MHQVRGKVDETYRRITARVDALALIEEEGIEDDEDDGGEDVPGGLSAPVGALRAAEEAPLYAGFIARLNAVVERYNNHIAIRRGRAAKK